MGYKLGAGSLKELNGVHPRLVECVQHAILITTQDFGVHDGLRSIADQKVLLNRGASKTRNSKHLTQPDGWGHAVDLVPYINGKLRWEWPLIYPIAQAMQTAARLVGIDLVWGGVWDRTLGSLNGDLRQHVAAYCARHPGPDFIDGPHYQIARLA
jgi:peptidoglycan L-alanyl-D-glutamate endopeptidase CwlK